MAPDDDGTDVPRSTAREVSADEIDWKLHPRDFILEATFNELPDLCRSYRRVLCEALTALHVVTNERDDARCDCDALREECDALRDKLERLEREAARLRVALLAADGVRP